MTILIPALICLAIAAVCAIILTTANILFGVKEDEFMANLDVLVERAFDDQCTGANPRYPLMSEIKEIFLNAYNGIV